jgi:restriction system protein
MTMKAYYRVMLGQGSKYAQQCLAGNFIGAHFGINQDLSSSLPEKLSDFNKQFIPIYLAGHPGKSKISAGLACGALWTVAKGIRTDDVVLCPDGTGIYRTGAVSGEYYYAPEEILPHRRKVTWLPTKIPRDEMSESLKHATGAVGTVSTVTSHATEIEKFFGPEPVIPPDPAVEDPVAFALEKHLEDFLVTSWDQTELSKEFSIFQEDGELAGQQFQTDTGPIDILAISKDGKRLLVIELKRGRASDTVVGQILRYMGYVKDQIAEPQQAVSGIIIALEDDQKLRRALSTVRHISFYRYQIDFKLLKA